MYRRAAVLGPIEFISYTADAVELFDRHGVSHHLFAGDKQLFTSARPSELRRCRHTVFRRASVTCKNGARRAGSNSMPLKQSLSGSVLGPLLVD